MEYEEEWRDIPGYEGRYRVSNRGSVMSLAFGGRSGVTGFLKPSINSRGYHFVDLSQRAHLVHRLVMCAFVGTSDLDVNHKDGNQQNNHLENLEYCTHQENLHHAVDTLGKYHGRLTLDDVREIRLLLSEGQSQKEIAKRFSITQSSVSTIKTRRYWNRMK